MKFIKYALLSIFILLASIRSFAQNGCPELGQNPASAFPVCGSNVFSQGVVKHCNGRGFVVTQCVNDGIPYIDINPYWYKFTCFKTGTLSFLITPNRLSDDYDWQLFDITNRQFEDIYTDPSLSVANNWSGNTGVTGATNSGKEIFNCGGDHPKISAMPTIIKGHDYLLMVSHFTDYNQYGYQLSFNTGSNGGTAVISDTLTPRISDVKLKCSGDRIGIKLNKLMLCSTLSTDGSGFSLSNNPKIDSVVGRGCRWGFDMDSITIYLAAAYTPGNYTLITKPDALGKTISDICGTSIPTGDTFPFFKVVELPTLMDSITTPLPCAPQQLELVFKTPLQCSSVLANGSQFSISGPSPVTIASATTNCDTNGLATKIYVNLSAPITTDGIYKIHLEKGTNFTTVINECSVPTPLDSLSFKAINGVSANYSFNTLVGCNQDTVQAKYIGIAIGSNNVTSWQWMLNDSLINTNSTASFIYNTFINKSLKLIVSNGVCVDSITTTIIPESHIIQAGFISPDTICGNVQAAFQDTSLGNTVSWKWSFGDGQTALTQSPPPHSYPINDSLQSYIASLIITNKVGCIDSAKHIVMVKPSTPSFPVSVDSVACAANTIRLQMSKPIDCNSVAADGSNFILTGADSIGIIGASVMCNNGFGTSINLSLSKLLKVNGVYKLQIIASNGKRLTEACGIVTLDTSVVFKSIHNVVASFDTVTIIGCKQDSIKVHNDGNNNINGWLWTLDNEVKTTQSAIFIDSTFIPKTIKLIATNGICTDSSTKTFFPINHSIKAGFISPEDTVCPTQQIIFTDTSSGLINSWKWTFGNGKSSSLQSPPAQVYPFSVTVKKYPISLIVKNIVGCIDSSIHIISVQQGVASIIDSITPLDCSATLVNLHFSNKLLCSSIAHNGSNFFITGPSAVAIDSASINCTNGAVSNVQLALSAPINVTGTYLVGIKKATDNTQINNVCNILTPIGMFKYFSAYGAVSAAFTTTIKEECKQAIITYKNKGANGINYWLWSFADSTSSYQYDKKDTTITYTDLSDKRVSLKVANQACVDSFTLQAVKLTNYNDTVKAGFIIEKDDVGTIEPTYFICPTEKAIYKDTSIGIIKNWLWKFGNGLISTSETPAPQSYQANGRNAIDYPVILIVKGNFCSDTTSNYIKVIPNCLIDVPRAFTPNGDNINDYLFPLNAYKADNLDFRVFNRFGQLVFETRDWTIKWDGTVNGAAPIVGTYIWTLTYTDHDTKANISRNGTTVLIK